MRTLIMISALTLSAAGHAADPTFIPEVAAGLQQAIERGDARAISVGLYDNGQTAVVGFGHVRRDDSSAPRGDSVFEIGSISKVFTSLLTQVQADEDLRQHLRQEMGVAALALIVALVLALEGLSAAGPGDRQR